jgi:homoserine O-acetyltransferase
MSASAWSDTLVESDETVEHLTLRSGDVLESGPLHYRTIGTRRLDGDGQTVNAVLLLHGTTGSGAQFLAPSFADAMFGPGQPLDASQWFTVIPDALGHGDSAKPSDGLWDTFPRYGYHDMVAGQHLLLQRLGIERVALVLGTSMGGMQTWMWGGLHPEVMDALIPIASAPTPISGRNLLWRQIIVRAIRTDPGYQAHEFDRPLAGALDTWPLFSLMASSVARLADLRTEADVSAFLDDTAAHAPNAADLLFALEASHDYDPRPLLRRIKAPLLAINFCDDEVNPAELDLLAPAMREIPSATRLEVKASDRTYGHQTLRHAGAYAEPVARLLAQRDPISPPSPNQPSRGAPS